MYVSFLKMSFKWSVCIFLVCLRHVRVHSDLISLFSYSDVTRNVRVIKSDSYISLIAITLYPNMIYNNSENDGIAKNYQAQ